MSRLIAELTASINALGYAAGKTHYFVDTECKEAIRELIRFLRRDDETHEIRRYLGAARILQSDLVPIVKNHHNDDEILDLILRLLVNLTTPALLLYNEEPPVDKVSNQQYFEIVGHLQEYKLAFAKQQIWTILSQKLSDLLKMDWADRGEEKSMIIVRILVLVRNVLHVPTDTDFENRPDNDADSHDQVLWALQEGGILDIILYIASSDDERQYFFHILEIVSLMLRDQNAEVLASASVQRSLAEKERDMEELIAARRKDKEEKQKRKSLIMSRHPRFSGTYVVKGVKSIGDNDLVVQSLDCKVALTFDRNKRKLKTPKNRQPMQTQTTERRSAFSVRVLMKEFCIEFLNGAYNGFMHYVRELLHRGKAQANDESYFFWALRFFMEFNRNYKCEVKLISETMHVSIFHFTQERIENWRARLDVEKKKFRLWSKRMHLGLKAYKELLMTLMKMYLHTDHTVKESAHTIMSNIFYVIEYRELLMVLMNIFDPIKFSTEYLKDLIEANHIFMKLLDHYCKRHRTLVVQKKGKSSKRKKKSKGPAAQHSASLLNLEPTEEKWEVLESKITDIFENNTELNVQSIPFDAASDVPFEEQKIEAMRKIRFFLLKSEVEEAVGLLRASREVWPENDCFGSENMSVSEECAALKEIFLADIGLPADANVSSDVANANAVEEDEESDNEGDDPQTDVTPNEQSFDFMDFMKKFAKPKIVQACCLLLLQFEQNSTFTNHCVLKLLHRIAFDCKFAAILFQASVFRTFQRILNSKEDRHKELKQFAVHIIRKFTEVAKRNTKVYIELLFWKGNKEAYEIEEGYGTLTSKGSNTKGQWSEEQEDELRRLHSEYERDRPEREMVDWIQANLIDQSRSRKNVVRKLRELGIGPAAVPQATRLTTRPPKEFSEEEIALITSLFNEYKEAYDIMGCIMERLEVQRPKSRIIEKILELGLVSHRSQLYKKKMKKSGGASNDGGQSESSSSAESGSDSASDNESDGDNHQSTIIPPLPLSASDIIDKIKQVMDLDMKNAVEWILSCLEEALEDIGDEESDVPILPLADFSVKAMDNNVFQSLLLALNIKRPVNFQEVYWRIPGTWLANDIRKRITIIQSGLSGNIDPSIDMEEILPTENPVAPRPSGDMSAPSDSAKDKKKRKRFNPDGFASTSTQQKPPRKKKKMSRIIRNDESDDDDLVASITKLKSKMKIPDKSDKENDVGLANGPENHNAGSDNLVVEPGPSSRILSSDGSDSEKESNQRLKSKPMQVEQKSRILGDSDSDTEFLSKKMSENSDSDDAATSKFSRKSNISKLRDSDEDNIPSKILQKSRIADSSNSESLVTSKSSKKSRIARRCDSDDATTSKPSKKSRFADSSDSEDAATSKTFRRSKILGDSDSDEDIFFSSQRSNNSQNCNKKTSKHSQKKRDSSDVEATLKPSTSRILTESDSEDESVLPSQQSEVSSDCHINKSVSKGSQESVASTDESSGSVSQPTKKSNTNSDDSGSKYSQNSSKTSQELTSRFSQQTEASNCDKESVLSSSQKSTVSKNSTVEFPVKSTQILKASSDDSDKESIKVSQKATVLVHESDSETGHKSDDEIGSNSRQKHKLVFSDESD